MLLSLRLEEVGVKLRVPGTLSSFFKSVGTPVTQFLQLLFTRCHLCPANLTLFRCFQFGHLDGVAEPGLQLLRLLVQVLVEGFSMGCVTCPEPQQRLAGRDSLLLAFFCLLALFAFGSARLWSLSHARAAWKLP